MYILLYSATQMGQCTSILLPSFCVLLTVVCSSARVLATLTTLLSFHAVATMLPHCRDVDSPRLNFFASSVMSEGKFLRFVLKVPQPYEFFEESEGGEKIIEVELMVFALDSDKVSTTFSPRACFSHPCRPSVDIEVVQIPIQSVGQSPYLETTLHWLQWQVLLHTRPTFEWYHSFVYTELTVWIVCRLKRSLREEMMGSTFCKREYPSSPRDGTFSLSAKCK